MNKYRIIQNEHGMYSAQVRVWFAWYNLGESDFPSWITEFKTIDKPLKLIEEHKAKTIEVKKSNTWKQVWP